MKVIDIKSWNRKEHFEFFSNFDDPFFGLVTEIDCTKAYLRSKSRNLSFFAYYLHRSILAIHRVDELKLRIVNKKVVMFKEIHACATISRADGTFGFSFMNFSPDLEIFNKRLKKEISKVQATTGLRYNEDAKRPDAIHYSTIPWNKFSGLKHPKKLDKDHSSPKITFGKFFEKGTKKILPISIEAHHGLVDGLHIAKYLEEFQNLMNE